MGVDILHFVDHDLPTDCAESFLAEFNKRVGADSKWHFFSDGDEGLLEKHFPNPGGNIHIYKADDNSGIELDLAKNTLLIWNLPGWTSEDLRQPIYIFDL